MCMNNSALKDIQQSLNIIRTEIEQVDSETKMAALELIMSTSQSVVAMARKLTKPKVKTKIKKVVEYSLAILLIITAIIIVLN